MTGVTEVLARITAIEQRFGISQQGFDTTTATASTRLLASGTSFTDALRQATLGTTGGTSGGASGAAVVASAQKYLGVPYLFGGTDPAVGLDCSALVQQAYSDLGISLPRTSAEQAKVGMPVASLADAIPGDLVAFNSPVSHIGIYAGNGQMVVAPHSGEVVRMETITKTPTAIRRVLATPIASVTAPMTTSASAWTPRPAALRGASAYAALFTAAETKYGLPSGLLDSVARVESSYDPNARSKAGAAGLMQLMPATAKAYGVDPYDPAQAIDAAGQLLKGQLDRFGSVELALAAYNAGGPAVAKYGGIPPYPETQSYVRKVLSYLSEAA